MQEADLVDVGGKRPVAVRNKVERPAQGRPAPASGRFCLEQEHELDKACDLDYGPAAAGVQDQENQVGFFSRRRPRVWICKGFVGGAARRAGLDLEGGPASPGKGVQLGRQAAGAAWGSGATTPDRAGARAGQAGCRGRMGERGRRHVATCISVVISGGSRPAKKATRRVAELKRSWGGATEWRLLVWPRDEGAPSRHTHRVGAPRLGISAGKGTPE